MKFFIKTLGCKVNQYEGFAIAKTLENNGFIQTNGIEDAEIFIINSCTVTETADKKIKQLMSSAKLSYPNLITAVIGCFPQAFPEAARALDADIIMGTSERKYLPAILNTHINNKNRKSTVNPIDDKYEELGVIPVHPDKTRATIKIEDGCNRNCAYCIIPKARGKVRSRGLSYISDEAHKIAENGNKEIVLAGVNLSCYGLDIGLSLCDAVEAVAGIDGIERIRLSSLEPDMMTDGVIKRLSRVSKLCPHFHLSLQSGCDKTLKRMNRLYTVSDYEKIIYMIKGNFDNPSITTDIIVGFSGETDEEFKESLDFVNKIKFAKIHVFTYSIREGTIAAQWGNHIESGKKAERYKMMSNAAKKSEDAFLMSQIGKTADVLIEKRRSRDFLFGHTANYTPVRIYNMDASRHSIVKAEISGVCGGFCISSDNSQGD